MPQWQFREMLWMEAIFSPWFRLLHESWLWHEPRSRLTFLRFRRTSFYRFTSETSTHKHTPNAMCVCFIGTMRPTERNKFRTSAPKISCGSSVRVQPISSLNINKESKLIINLLHVLLLIVYRGASASGTLGKSIDKGEKKPAHTLNGILILQ